MRTGLLPVPPVPPPHQQIYIVTWNPKHVGNCRTRISFTQRSKLQAGVLEVRHDTLIALQNTVTLALGNNSFHLKIAAL
jgi:hypothetical protein